MFPGIYIYSIYCGDIYGLTRIRRPGLQRWAPGSHEASDSSTSPSSSATNIIPFGLFFFFFLPVLCDLLPPPAAPTFLLNPGESKESGEKPELVNLMPKPEPGPGGKRLVLSPKHRTSALDRATAAVDYSYEYLKKESCKQTPAEKADKFR